MIRATAIQSTFVLISSSRSLEFFTLVTHLVAGFLPSKALIPPSIASLSPWWTASLGACAVPHSTSFFIILPAWVTRGGHRALFVSPSILHRLWTWENEGERLSTSYRAVTIIINRDYFYSFILFLHSLRWTVQYRMCFIKAHYAMIGEYKKEKNWQQS